MVLAFTAAPCWNTRYRRKSISQIVQTIEMFEVITQTQPDDYQSLEILKEALSKDRPAGGVAPHLAHAGRGVFQCRLLHARDAGV